jgi:hypothetical protein
MIKLEVYFEKDDQEELESVLDDLMEEYPNLLVVISEENPN